MALAPQLMGPQSVRFYCTLQRMFHPFRMSRREPAVKGGFAHRMKIGMQLQKCPDGSLIFLRCKRTCGVHQRPAGQQHPGRRFQNALLPFCTVLHIVRAPLFTRLRVFAEHPLTGAGSVHHDPVKECRKPLRQPIRRLVGHHCVGNAHPLHILSQDLRPGRVDLIGHQQTHALHVRGQMGRLAAGSRAQIQHPLSGSCPCQLPHRHGAGLLHIVKSRLMVHMPTRPVFLSIIKAVSRPGHPFQRKGSQRKEGFF